MTNEMNHVASLPPRTMRTEDEPATRRSGMSAITGPEPLHAERAPRAASWLRNRIPSVVINWIIPLLAYILIRPRVSTDAEALAIGGAIPVAWTIGIVAWRRHIDPIGVIAVLGFAGRLAISALSGGSALSLKLDPLLALEGVIGLIFLVSAAVRRPLLPAALQLLARGNPKRATVLSRAMSDPARRRSFTVGTALVGFLLVAHAAAHVILALSLSTGTYLVVARLVNWAVIGAGAAAFFWYRHRRTLMQAGEPAGAKDRCSL
jgi:hypothetical protein